MKTRAPASTHKKVVVVLADKKPVRGYLNPSRLGQLDPIDLLTPDGEHEQLPLTKIRSIYFVRDFAEDFEPERKAFGRPKLDGLWVRLRYTDNETLEGVVPNDLLARLDNGLQITPPDLNFHHRPHLYPAHRLGRSHRPRRSGRGAPQTRDASTQPRLFSE